MVGGGQKFVEDVAVVVEAVVVRSAQSAGSVSASPGQALAMTGRRLRLASIESILNPSNSDGMNR